MSKLNKLRPKTFFEELAIDEHLREYIDTNETILKRYKSDITFRNEMLNLLYVHSKDFQEDVEETILTEISEALSYFSDNTQQWNKNSQ